MVISPKLHWGPYGQLREVVLSINRTYIYTIIYCVHLVHTVHIVGNASGSSGGTAISKMDAFIDAYSGGGDGSTQVKFEGNTGNKIK